METTGQEERSVEDNRRPVPSQEREGNDPAHGTDGKKSARTETASELTADEASWLYLTTSDPAFLLEDSER